MELILFFLGTAGHLVIKWLIIALFAIPGGIGLAIGIDLGRKFLARIRQRKLLKKAIEYANITDQCTAIEQTR